MQLWYGNNLDGYILKLEGVSVEDAWKWISNWRKDNAPQLHLDGHGYYRSHETDGVTHIDYGSHVNFFEIRP